MSTAWRLLLVALVAAGGCASRSTPTGDPTARLPAIPAPDDPGAYEDDLVRSQIMAVLTSYYRDFSERDWDHFALHFWPDATITTVWTPAGETRRRVAASSVEQFIAEAAQEPDDAAGFAERMGEVEIYRRGNLAIVMARYEAQLGHGRDLTRWSGYDAFTLMRDRGQWKITHLAFAAE